MPTSTSTRTVDIVLVDKALRWQRTTQMTQPMMMSYLGLMTLVFFLVIPSNVDREALIGLATMPSLSILLYACFIHLQRRPPKTLVRAVEAAIDERFDVSVAVDAGLNKFVGRTQDGRYVEGRLIVNHGVSNQVVVVFEQE